MYEASEATERLVTGDLVWSVEPREFGLLAWNRNFEQYLLEKGIRVRTGMAPEEVHPGNAFRYRELYARALDSGGFHDICRLADAPAMDAAFERLERGNEVFAISVAVKSGETPCWYREVFLRALNGICRTSPDGRFIEANPAMARILGYDSPEEMIRVVTDPGTQLWIDPLDRCAATAQLAQHGFIRGLECRFRRKDGSPVWVSVNGRMVRESAGAAAFFEGAIEEIDARKRADEALRKSESHFRTLFEHAPQGIALVDQETGCFLRANPAYCRITGRTAEEMARTPFFAITHPDDVNSNVASVESMKSGASAGFQEDKRYIRPDGSVIWVRITVAGFKENVGPPMHLAIVEDITARKKAEDELRKSEQKFAAFFRFNPAIMTISQLEPEERLLDVNEAFERTTGYRREEVIGRDTAEFWVDQAQREKMRRDAAARGRVDNFLTEFRMRGGPVITGLLSAVIIEIDGRKHAISAVLDLTEQKRAERRLEESEAKFRAIVENSHDGILFADENLEILYRSPSYRRLNGYRNDERVGTNGFDAIHADDVAHTRRVWEQALRHPERAHRVEYRTRHKHGHWMVMESSVQNFLGNPAVRAMLVTTRDITEQHRAEEELRLAEAKLQETTRHFLAVAKCVPDVIWSMDLDGRFTYVSSAVERTYGYTVDEFLNLTRADTATADSLELGSVLRRELDLAAAPDYPRGRIVSLESQPMRKDGSRFWAEIKAGLVWSDDGRPIGWTGISRDITEQKLAEAEREKLWEQLAQAQKMESVGRLAGGIAHDFNNLLTVINGYSQAAVAKMGADDPLRESMSEIYQAGTRAAALTRQLLAFSRKQILRLRAMDLNTVVRGMESMLRRLMGEDVEVRFEAWPAPVTVMADAHQLEQAVMNLAVNARDAMPAGGTLRIATRLEDWNEPRAAAQNNAKAGPYAVLDVSDSGTGIDPATLKRIFEPFFTTKEQGRGTGLGLSTVQGIVEQSGGFLTVESQPGHGARFSIFLPAIEAAGIETRHKIPETQPAAGSETVLVVEDEREVQKFIAATLQLHGYRVLEAANGVEAQAFCQGSQRIDLLLSDLVMPGMNGRELAAKIGRLRPRIKTLFMSGYTDDVVVCHGMADEGVNFIQKPFQTEELLEKIRAALGK